MPTEIDSMSLVRDRRSCIDESAQDRQWHHVDVSQPPSDRRSPIDRFRPLLRGSSCPILVSSRRMLASLLGLALALGAASPEEPAVSWQAPPACADASAVRQRIEDLLRRPLAADEVRVEAVVRAEGSGFVLRLRVRTGEVVDERELRAERCAALADATALVAAVMVDPAVADTLLVPEPDASPTTTPEPETTPGPAEDAASPSPETTTPAPTEPEPTPAELTPAEPIGSGLAGDRTEPAAPRSGLGLWLRARAGGEYGAIPDGTGGFALALALGGPRLRGELEGHYWIGRLAESTHASARVHLGLVAARACGVVPAQRPLAVGLCAGVELGAVRAAAQQPAPLTRHRPWLAAQAEVALRWQPRPRVALWIGAQPFVPIVFPRFELRDPAAPDAPETIHVPTPVGIRGLAGVELRVFP